MKTTNVTLLTSKEKASPKKPIEFTHYVNDHLVITDTTLIGYTGERPCRFDNVSLISMGEQFDVIAAWNNGDGPTSVCVFLGRWNDGFVEPVQK